MWIAWSKSVKVELHGVSLSPVVKGRENLAKLAELVRAVHQRVLLGLTGGADRTSGTTNDNRAVAVTFAIALILRAKITHNC